VTSLVFIAGPNTGRRYELTEGEYVIGRRSDCQVFVPDMRVSRQHARLRQNAGRWEIEDLGSNNGTWVNGARIAAPQPVRAGDEVTIASNRIRVEGAADDAEHHHSSGDARLTIVEAAGPVVRSREDSGAHPLVRVTTPLSASTELRNLRLLERKLTALTAILAAAAKTPDPEALLEGLLDPAARDVLAGRHRRRPGRGRAVGRVADQVPQGPRAIVHRRPAGPGHDHHPRGPGSPRRPPRRGPRPPAARSRAPAWARRCRRRTPTTA
jgi:hypothetical protein